MRKPFFPLPIIALSSGIEYEIIFKSPNKSRNFKGKYRGVDGNGWTIVEDSDGRLHHINNDEILEFIETKRQ